MFKEEIRHWNEIDYAVVMQREDDKSWVDFKVYKIVGYDKDSKPCYNLKGSDSETCDWLEIAQIFSQGRIKWDGCCDMEFIEAKERDVMLHFCSIDDATALGDLMSNLYELAAEMMPEHKEELV